jgi:hypothetical protein
MDGAKHRETWNLMDGAEHRETWNLMDGAEHKETWYLVNGAEQMETWYYWIVLSIRRLGTLLMVLSKTKQGYCWPATTVMVSAA